MTTPPREDEVSSGIVGNKREWIAPKVDRHDIREEVSGPFGFGSDGNGRKKMNS